jgi:predicted O-methyltransferase YrrM
LKIKNNIHKLAAYTNHAIKARRIDLKGIQSPFLFSFVSNITKNLWPFYAFNSLESIRNEILIEKKEVYQNYLPCAKTANKNEVIAGQTIFRIINEIKAEKMLEIGTLFGIDTLYMIKANQTANCITISDNLKMAALTGKNIKKSGETSISILSENHDIDLAKALNNLKTIDFVLFNASKDEKQRLDDFRKCLSVKHQGTVFVMKYIHETKGMENTWNIVRNHPEVSASIDLFFEGILFFRQDLGKKNYIVRLKK